MPNEKKNKEVSIINDSTLNDSVNGVLEQLNNDKAGIILEVEGNKIQLTNLNKVFWPESTANETAVSKRGYIQYLAKVAPYLLKHLKDRPLTLVRYPNGITGGKFYQRHWDNNRAPFVNTVRYYSEHVDEDQDFLLCNNLSTLLWLAQIADLELHTAHTRVSLEPDALNLSSNYIGSVGNIEQSVLNYPDFIVFDLDPYLYSGKEEKGEEPELHREGFKKAAEAAHWLKEVLDSLNCESFIKTSGRTGLHIYLPILREIDYTTVRRMTEIIGKRLLAAHPQEITMDWAVIKRTGKVFFDHNMNARGKSLASIYSPRIDPHATVSTPLRWNEIDKVYPTDFTMETVPERLAKLGDLWHNILDQKNDLSAILKRKGGREIQSALDSDSAPAKKSPRRLHKAT